MLVAKAYGERSSPTHKPVDAGAEVDGVHVLGALRRQHAAVVVDEASIVGEEGLHGAARAIVNLEAFWRDTRSVVRYGCGRIRRTVRTLIHDRERRDFGGIPE
jgi:hypothetical protein